jgi:hypothetical protein
MGSLDGVAVDSLDELAARLCKVEDELAIRRLVLSYGPAADAGLTGLAASIWAEDGQYDWNAGQPPYESAAAVEEMLEGDLHQGLIRKGVAHFSGPLLIDLEGDRAIALNYSMVMRQDPDNGRYWLWRVSAVRWEVERDAGSWKLRCRTNRLMDATGAGRELFGESLRQLFPDGKVP